VGPCFVILPEKRLTINEEIVKKFKGNFKVKFFFF
jgi:hypothetical protein